MISIDKLFPRLIKDRRLVVWGTGSASDKWLEKVLIDVNYFIDNNQSKWGTTFQKKVISNPSFLQKEHKKQIIIVILSDFYKEISNQLYSYGYKKEQIITLSLLQQAYYDYLFEIEKKNNDKIGRKFNYYFQLAQQASLTEKEDLDIIRTSIKRELLEYYLPYSNLRKVISALKDKKIINYKIVFNSATYYPTEKEMYLAYILAKIGGDVEVLYDDGLLKHWEVYQHSQGYKLEELNPLSSQVDKTIKGKLLNFTMKIRMHTLHEAYEHQNIRLIPYSGIIDKEIDIQDNYSNCNIDIKLEKYSKSSARRYFETDKLDFNNPLCQEYYNYSLYNANVSLRVGKFIKDVINPDIFITSHGIYSTWGPAYEFLSQSHVKTWVYGLHAHMPQTVAIDENISLLYNESKDWETYKGNNLTNLQKKLVDQYLKDRISFKAPDTQLYYKDIDSTKSFEMDKNGSYVFCAYPNVIWDGAEEERDIVFGGVIDWLIQTINYFRDLKNKILVIRCHPAESTLFKGVKTVESILREKIADLDSINNVYIISSNYPLNTYEFSRKYVDIALVYNGFPALELPYMNIPTIVCGRGTYNVKDVNIGVETRKRYFGYIDEPSAATHEFKKMNKEMLYKYLYWYLFEATYYLPIIDKHQQLTQRIFLDDTDVFKNPKLKRTIEKILSQRIG